MRFIYYTAVLIAIALLQSCAQIVAPTGGPVDEAPPKLDSVGTFPANYSTNFVGNKISLTFDEYFVVKNPTANVFFSPSLAEDPEFLTSGKTLTILLKNTLKENTTYTINFGDAISDFNAGNKITDFKYVFSTGDFLDSMSTGGIVLDAFSGEPKKEIMVMLYEDFSDSVVSRSKPVYYAMTGEDGRFSINYIKAGKYKMAALEDKNRNFKYDLPNEMIGSLDGLLNLADTNSQFGISISVFERDYKKQSIETKKYSFPGKLSFVFTRPADTVLIMDTNGNPISFHSLEYGVNRDSLIVWKPEIANKKNELNIKLDTATIRYKLYEFVKPKKDTGLRTESITKTIEVSDPIIITFDRPISSFDSSLIKLFNDSIQLATDSFKMSGRTLSVYFKKKQEVNYKYQFLPIAFQDIFGYATSDTLNGFITIREADYYGIFTLKLKAKDSSSYIVQLMNEEGKVLREKSSIGTSNISFEKLAPGKYKVKAIKDANKNGKWDTGDYYKKLKPESVLFFEVPIEIRSNWEVAETWEI
ncbi:MAG: Ig-like domain-containing protein [Flavobacteriales bacterium]